MRQHLAALTGTDSPHTEDWRHADGAVVSCTAPRQRYELSKLLQRHGLAELSAEASTADRVAQRPTRGRAAFGAPFAQVDVDPQWSTGQVRRLVGAFAGGRIVNRRLAHSQMVGAWSEASARRCWNTVGWTHGKVAG